MIHRIIPADTHHQVTDIMRQPLKLGYHILRAIAIHDQKCDASIVGGRLRCDSTSSPPNYGITTRDDGSRRRRLMQCHEELLSRQVLYGMMIRAIVRCCRFPGLAAPDPSV